MNFISGNFFLKNKDFMTIYSVLNLLTGLFDLKKYT